MESKKIGTRVYHVGNIPPRRALKTLKRLVTMVEPAMGGLVGLKAKSADDVSDAETGRILKALGDALSKIPDADLDFIIDEIASVTRVELADGVKDLSVFGVDAAFSGDLAGLMEWVVFGVKVNFAPLLPALMAKG